MNNGRIQILNPQAVKTLKHRLKRDKLLKDLYDERLKLYRFNILMDSEYIKSSNIKIAMNNEISEVYELYKRKRSTNVKMLLEHKKITEMKLDLINKIVTLDEDSLTQEYKFERENKISELTDRLNETYPDGWTENKEIISNRLDAIAKEIVEHEKKVETLRAEADTIATTIRNYEKKCTEINESIVQKTNEILKLNNFILDAPEEQVVYLVKPSSEYDLGNMSDMFNE
jgi:hypothetical protein